MKRVDRIVAGLMGGYVADAAALGFHWLYDPDRIAELAGDAPAFREPNAAAFREPNAADFEGFKGVFVHPNKRAGDISQYGTQLRVAIQSMIATDGRFDITDFQDRFAATFGPGGSWVGYMDKATKGTLANLAQDLRSPSGADDDQVPSIARFPAVMAQASVSAADVDAIIAITNVNEEAAKWGPIAASLLRAAYEGMSPREAAVSIATKMQGEIGEALLDAVRASERDTVAYAGTVGRACYLRHSMPVIFHICARADSYRDAIERNILAGGDNCGRAPVLGAVFAASNGIGGSGVPLEWGARVTDIADLTAEIAALAKKSS